MTRFAPDNTADYSREELDLLNREWERLGGPHIEDKSEADRLAEQILRDYDDGRLFTGAPDRLLKYGSASALRTRLFEALVERAARARCLRYAASKPLCAGGSAHEVGWHSGVFDTCQKIAVAELGYSDAEFLAAVKARQESA